jgi:hypothetical protein
MSAQGVGNGAILHSCALTTMLLRHIRLFTGRTKVGTGSPRRPREGPGRPGPGGVRALPAVTTRRPATEATGPVASPAEVTKGAWREGQSAGGR